MSLEDVGKFIEDILDEDVSLGTMNKSVKKGIGVYRRRSGVGFRGVVGSLPSGYDIFGITLLLRLGADAVVADKRAWEIYNKLVGEQTRVLLPLYNAPVWIGVDGTFIYEYVIDLDLLYNYDLVC